jgi:hypothetical protein
MSGLRWESIGILPELLATFYAPHPDFCTNATTATEFFRPKLPNMNFLIQQLPSYCANFTKRNP